MSDDRPDRAELAKASAEAAEEAAEASSCVSVIATLRMDELKEESNELRAGGVEEGRVVAAADRMPPVSVTEAETETGAVAPESIGRPAADEIWSQGTPKTTAVPPTTSDTWHNSPLAPP